MNKEKNIAIYSITIIILLLFPSLLGIVYSVDLATTNSIQIRPKAATETLEVIWGDNGTVVCDEISNQNYPNVCDDGSGGAFIVWRDPRGGNQDIYAQRIDASGNEMWTGNGTLICNADFDQSNVKVVGDGKGGAIIIWEDFRDVKTDIYAQHINASGGTTWANNGIVVCNGTGEQKDVEVVGAFDGGAIAVWKDFSDSHIYAQFIYPNGTVEFPVNGITICNETGVQSWPKICSDGEGGAIIVWTDSRSGYLDIYAQRIDCYGELLWTSGGDPVCWALNNQFFPEICSDGVGGGVVTWYDNRTGNLDIYSQCIDKNGKPIWTIDGVLICNAPNSQVNPVVCSDGLEGAIIAWRDYRSGDYDLYAQRISSNGILMWNPNTYPICKVIGDQNPVIIRSDGGGGAIITWQDQRTIKGIYAQRVNSTGHTLWTTNGMPICTAGTSQIDLKLFCDGNGSAFITWRDNRKGDYNIYAQCIQFSFTPPSPPNSNDNNNDNNNYADEEIVRMLMIGMGILGAILIVNVIYTIKLHKKVNKNVREFPKEITEKN